MNRTLVQEQPPARTAPLEAAASSAAADVTRLRPVDWFTLVYLGIVLVLFMVLTNRNAEILRLAGLHVAGMAALVAARKFGLARWTPGEYLLAFYPLLLSAFLYTEIGPLVEAMHPGVLHDALIQRWEVSLFGGHPSQDLHLRGWRILGEYLHLGYISYYVLAPVLAVTLWFSRSRTQFDTSIGTISLSFYVSFLIFLLYPVAGPYQVMNPPAAASVGYLIPDLTRWILDRGSSVGAAFPSSHVAVAVTVWIMAMRYHSPVAIVYVFLVPALALGAIYGGYHYATDVLAGLVLGVLVGTVGYRLTTRVWARGT